LLRVTDHAVSWDSHAISMVRSVVDGGLSQADAAYQFNRTPKTVAKWVEWFRTEGVGGLRDRSSRPHREVVGQETERFQFGPMITYFQYD